MYVFELIAEVFRALPKTLRGIAGWTLVYPVARLLPKRRDLMVVIGRDKGEFTSNAKYFYIEARQRLAPDVEVVFVTEDEEVLQKLQRVDARVIGHLGIRSIGTLLRARILVVDSAEWVWNWKRFLLAGAVKIQLWHGVGYKRIELDKWENEARGNKLLSALWLKLPRLILKSINGRLVKYDIVVSTSRFYRDFVFSKAFLSREHLITGYPRNTFGKIAGAPRSLTWLNVDEHIKNRLQQWKAEDRKLVLVTPTYKDTRKSQMGLDRKNIKMLDDFCEEHGVELIFKFHPIEKGELEVEAKHLHVCDPHSDIYPLMPHTHAMITDYSSIYMDYLLLDRPVIFLVPDIEDYSNRDRQFQFDFHEMTPGPKVEDWKEVMTTLQEQWTKDNFAEKRRHLATKAFDGIPQKEAVTRLLAHLHKRGWLIRPTDCD